MLSPSFSSTFYAFFLKWNDLFFALCATHSLPPSLSFGDMPVFREHNLCPQPCSKKSIAGPPSFPTGKCQVLGGIRSLQGKRSMPFGSDKKHTLQINIIGNKADILVSTSLAPWSVTEMVLDLEREKAVLHVCPSSPRSNPFGPMAK